MPGAANQAEDKEAVETEHHKFVRIGLGTMHRDVKSAGGTWPRHTAPIRLQKRSRSQREEYRVNMLHGCIFGV
jgi:hypothetical protein